MSKDATVIVHHAPHVVMEVTSQAEDSVTDNTPPEAFSSTQSDAVQIYPKDVARKYHFVETYIEENKVDKSIKHLQEKPVEKKKNLLNKLLSDSYHIGGVPSLDLKSMKTIIPEATQRQEENESKLETTDLLVAKSPDIKTTP